MVENTMSNDVLHILARSLARQLKAMGYNVFCTDNWSPEIIIWPGYVTKYHSTPFAEAKMICNFYDSYMLCGPMSGSSRHYEYCNPEFPDNLYEYVKQFIGGKHDD